MRQRDETQYLDDKHMKVKFGSYAKEKCTCGGRLQLRPMHNGPRYVCLRDNCENNFHASRKTGELLAKPAGRQVRSLRRRAHKVFDRLWKGKDPLMNRKDAYKLLQQMLNVSEEEAHIGQLSKKQLQALGKKLYEMGLIGDQEINSLKKFRIKEWRKKEKWVRRKKQPEKGNYETTKIVED